jgi:hypothetical protein
MHTQIQGNRGYGGDVYGGRVLADQRTDDARGLLAETGRSLGLVGARASELGETELVSQSSFRSA